MFCNGTRSTFGSQRNRELIYASNNYSWISMLSFSFQRWSWEIFSHTSRERERENISIITTCKLRQTCPSASFRREPTTNKVFLTSLNAAKVLVEARDIDWVLARTSGHCLRANFVASYHTIANRPLMKMDASSLNWVWSGNKKSSSNRQDSRFPLQFHSHWASSNEEGSILDG